MDTKKNMDPDVEMEWSQNAQSLHENDADTEMEEENEEEPKKKKTSKNGSHVRSPGAMPISMPKNWMQVERLKLLQQQMLKKHKKMSLNTNNNNDEERDISAPSFLDSRSNLSKLSPGQNNNCATSDDSEDQEGHLFIDESIDANNASSDSAEDLVDVVNNNTPKHSCDDSNNNAWKGNRHYTSKAEKEERKKLHEQISIIREIKCCDRDKRYAQQQETASEAAGIEYLDMASSGTEELEALSVTAINNSLRCVIPTMNDDTPQKVKQMSIKVQEPQKERNRKVIYAHRKTDSPLCKSTSDTVLKKRQKKAESFTEKITESAQSLFTDKKCQENKNMDSSCTKSQNKAIYNEKHAEIGNTQSVHYPYFRDALKRSKSDMDHHDQNIISEPIGNPDGLEQLQSKNGELGIDYFQKKLALAKVKTELWSKMRDMISKPTAEKLKAKLKEKRECIETALSKKCQQVHQPVNRMENLGESAANEGIDKSKWREIMQLWPNMSYERRVALLKKLKDSRLRKEQQKQRQNEQQMNVENSSERKVINVNSADAANTKIKGNPSTTKEIKTESTTCVNSITSDTRTASLSSMPGPASGNLAGTKHPPQAHGVLPNLSQTSTDMNQQQVVFQTHTSLNNDLQTTISQNHTTFISGGKKYVSFPVSDPKGNKQNFYMEISQDPRGNIIQKGESMPLFQTAAVGAPTLVSAGSLVSQPNASSKFNNMHVIVRHPVSISPVVLSSTQPYLMYPPGTRFSSTVTLPVVSSQVLPSTKPPSPRTSAGLSVVAVPKSTLHSLAMLSGSNKAAPVSYVNRQATCTNPISGGGTFTRPNVSHIAISQQAMKTVYSSNMCHHHGKVVPAQVFSTDKTSPSSKRTFIQFIDPASGQLVQMRCPIGPKPISVLSNTTHTASQQEFRINKNSTLPAPQQISLKTLTTATTVSKHVQIKTEPIDEIVKTKPVTEININPAVNQTSGVWATAAQLNSVYGTQNNANTSLYTGPAPRKFPETINSSMDSFICPPKKNDCAGQQTREAKTDSGLEGIGKNAEMKANVVRSKHDTKSMTKEVLEKQREKQLEMIKEAELIYKKTKNDCSKNKSGINLTKEKTYKDVKNTFKNKKDDKIEPKTQNQSSKSSETQGFRLSVKSPVPFVDYPARIVSSKENCDAGSVKMTIVASPPKEKKSEENKSKTVEETVKNKLDTDIKQNAANSTDNDGQKDLNIKESGLKEIAVQVPNKEASDMNEDKSSLDGYESYDSADMESYQKFMRMQSTATSLKRKSQLIESYFTTCGKKHFEEIHIEAKPAHEINGTYQTPLCESVSASKTTTPSKPVCTSVAFVSSSLTSMSSSVPMLSAATWPSPAVSVIASADIQASSLPQTSQHLPNSRIMTQVNEPDCITVPVVSTSCVQTPVKATKSQSGHSVYTPVGSIPTSSSEKRMLKSKFIILKGERTVSVEIFAEIYLNLI